jgi:Asp-tRNA(Asn)/Glu-tRNA(Gln) amidotransferase A subunit family amidase
MSAAELVRSCLERIDRLSYLNAVVALRAEEAESEARRSDAARADGAAPRPLEGIPFLVKDNEALAGTPTTYGSLLRANAPAEGADGTSAARLRKLGAIPIGKTNLPEFAFDGFTANRLFGATLNPWNPDYSPGGSSGGSAVALATGMAPIATATDVGGSARIPAAMCGLIGLKLTEGALPLDPLLPSPRFNGHGLMGITADNVGYLLSALTGSVVPGSLDFVESGGSTTRLLAAPRMWPDPHPSAVADEWQATLARLKELGIEVREIQPMDVTGPEYDPHDWFRLVGVDQLQALGPDTPTERGQLMTSLFRSQMTAAAEVRPRERDAALRRVSSCTEHLDQLLAGGELLVTPTLAVPGWTANGSLGDAPPGVPGWVYNTEPQNLTGHPAISIPAGLSTNGVPFGMQVTGPRWSEHLLLAFAARWEAANPFSLPPISDLAR